MKFLGLLGVLLWLGTFLANARGAEMARLQMAIAADWSVHVYADPAAGVVKADVVSGSFSGALSDIAAADSPLVLSPAGEVLFELRGPGMWAARHMLVAWHPGRGPPHGSFANCV